MCEEFDVMCGFVKGMIKVGVVGSIVSFVLLIVVGCVFDCWLNLCVEIIEGVWDWFVEGLIKYEIDFVLFVYGFDIDEIVVIFECCWEDCSYIVVVLYYLLCVFGCLLMFVDMLYVCWVILLCGIVLFDYMCVIFDVYGLLLFDIVVEMCLVMMFKSLVVYVGFLSWMVELMVGVE